MPAHGMFVWNELMTNDVEKAKTFYAATIGWTFDGMEMGPSTYWVCKEGDKMVGGIMDMTGVTPPGVPPHWFSYLEVDDVDARAAKLEANGGKIIRPPFDIPGVGRIAILADPTGAAMGWMTSAQR
jgi:predicted enzyme related to lactoylglutathione lyase